MSLRRSWGNSDISPQHLQDRTIEPRFFNAYRKLSLEKRQSDGYYVLLLGYSWSLFRDFESYFKIAVGLNEGDIRLK